MSIQTVAGILFVLLLIVGVGFISGRKVKNAGDFLTGGGQAGPFLVCGAILGSLVSSQATIGTAQLAFHFGVAAWWFTLGSGIGCLVLAVAYVRPLRRSGCVTELQVISEEYGPLAGSLGSVLCSVGIFISVLAQVVACAGLLSTLFPIISSQAAAGLSVAVMCFYVIFGGAWGAGMGGVVKLILLYVASVASLVFTLTISGGLGGLLESLNRLLAGTALGSIQQEANGLGELLTGSDIFNRFGSLIARGTARDIGSGVSLLLGVLSTQTYAQAIWSAESDRKARAGALLSAFLIPPIGAAGICIGLYMRSHYLLQTEVEALQNAGQAVPQMPILASTIQVFPAFVLNHLPPLFGGIVLGTLLITVVGGGAGLSLGMATILVKDIFKPFTRCVNTPARELWLTRISIAVILACAALFAILVPGSMINDLGFLSMGLRGAVVFLPMTCALVLPGKIDRRYILGSIVLAPLAVLLGRPLPFDSLFLGVLVSAVCCAAGTLSRRREAPTR
jgi:SSS family solute:Na+ symporter